METCELSMLHGSAEIGELAGALAAAQAEFVAVPKDNTAKVETKSGPAYSYKYADLAGCLAAVRQPLSRHGLCVMQVTVPGEKDLMLRTILAHQSGQWIASDFPLVAGDWSRPQAVGSAITYARRYTLCALLQIATDDDDGAEAQRLAEQRKPARQATPDRRDAAAAPAPARRPPYRQWLEDFCTARNREWAAKHPETAGDLMPIFRMNRHLLGYLMIEASPTDEAANLKAGADAWRENAHAMEAEALGYCRIAWAEKAARLKAGPAREPGSDDMPSPDAMTAR